MISRDYQWGHIMTQTRFDWIAGVIFLIMAIVHVLRLIQGWDLTVDGTAIPFWVNWVGLIITGGMAFFAFLFGARRSPPPRI
jgi:hypothetical protein